MLLTETGREGYTGSALGRLMTSFSKTPSFGWRRLRRLFEGRHDTVAASSRSASPVEMPPALRSLLSPGLPTGTGAMDFELRDIFGSPMTLSQWRGRHVLLLFIDPGCPHSEALLPELQSFLSEEQDNDRVSLLVSTGDATANRALLERSGVRTHLLLQEDMEVADLYQVRATPTAYLIDEHGTIVSEATVGLGAILGLVAPSSPTPWQSMPFSATVRPLGPDNTIRISATHQRLLSGARAPDFRLPTIDGQELSLSDFHGRPILLVFSDPRCSPCGEVAAALEQIHRRTAHLQLVMVSREDLDESRIMAFRHDLTFPVAVQRRWEVSRSYGILATPVAYLIDEDGTITQHVALGREEILALAASAGQPARQREIYA